MSDHADNGQQPNETPAAGEQEPSIPKYRFDQVASRLRQLEEALQIKDHAISQLQAAMMPQQKQDEDEEILQALEPSQLKAVSKLLDKKLNLARQELGGVVGGLANRVDEQNFLLRYGKDKEKYLAKINDMRKQHAQRGAYLDYDMAYKLIRSDELEAMLEKKASEPAKTAAAQAAPEKPAEAPPPAAPQGAAPKKKTIEELEAELDEQIRSSGRGI